MRYLNILIAVLIFIWSTYAVSMGSTSQYNVDFVLAPNSDTTANSDLTVKVSYPSDIYTGAQGLWVAWINTNSETYSLSADTAGLTTLIYSDYCLTATCASSSDTTGDYTVGTTNYVAAAGTYTWQGSGTKLTAVTQARTYPSSTETKAKWTNMTSTQVTLYGLPAQNAKAYYTCFSVYDTTVTDFTAGSTVSITVQTSVSEKNVTLSNNSMNSFTSAHILLLTVTGLIISS